MGSDRFEKTIPLSEATKFIVDNRGKTAPAAETGIALIATNCVTNDHLYPLYEKLRFVSQETYDTWFRAHPQPGDILLTCKGSQNGAVCLVPDPVDFAIAQDMVAIRANEEVIDPLFLFAALRSPSVQAQIKNLDVSGVIPHFKKGDFNKLLLPYPDRDTQKVIGRIYFEMCAKIELNRKMNATLEQMSQALFKSWFVDFDPVKAKAEGLVPEGIDADTAALFPSEFEESEQGQIPKGWRVAELSDLLLQRNQRAKVSPQTESIPYVPIECITSKSIFLAEYRPGQEAQSSLILFFEGDILFGAMRPYFHKVCLAPFDGVTRTTTFVLKHRRQEDKAFSLFTVFQDSTIEHATLHSEGSTIPYAKWENSLERMKIVLPTSQVRAIFGEKIKRLIEKGNQSIRESKTLAEMRDAVLPRLISGQLRIPEAETKAASVL